jgi:hypothetical protein
VESGNVVKEVSGETISRNGVSMKNLGNITVSMNVAGIGKEVMFVNLSILSVVDDMC